MQGHAGTVCSPGHPYNLQQSQQSLAVPDWLSKCLYFLVLDIFSSVNFSKFCNSAVCWSDVNFYHVLQGSTRGMQSKLLPYSRNKLFALVHLFNLKFSFGASYITHCKTPWTVVIPHASSPVTHKFKHLHYTFFKSPIFQTENLWQDPLSNLCIITVLRFALQRKVILH